MPQGQPAKWSRALQRVSRIQGQLNGLKSAIEEDRNCEDLIIQAHAIEKALSSLIVHIVESHIDYQTNEHVEEDIEDVLRSIKRLLALSLR